MIVAVIILLILLTIFGRGKWGSEIIGKKNNQDNKYWKYEDWKDSFDAIEKFDYEKEREYQKKMQQSKSDYWKPW